MNKAEVLLSFVDKGKFCHSLSHAAASLLLCV